MIIDMHVHLSENKPDEEWVWMQWPGSQRIGINAELFIEKMDACKPRIDKALIFGLTSLASYSPEHTKADNDYILKVAEKYPERYVGAGVIDPSWGDKSVSELERFHKADLKVVKIRFSSMHYHANNKAGQKIFTEIEKRDMLPVCHSDWTHYSNPLVLGDLAMMFPDLKMVMQHFGEYLSYDAISVCKKASNIYVDTSALVHPKNICKFIKDVSPNRVMYASDILHVRGHQQPQDALNRILCLDLPKEQEKKVLGGNAFELLRSVGVEL